MPGQKKCDYSIPFKGYPVFPGYHEKLIPVPAHCLERMFWALSASEMVVSGSCLERDILIAEECMRKELTKAKRSMK